jgi:hypothetical protein
MSNYFSFRGGYYLYFAQHVRCAYRYGITPAYCSYFYLGFRPILGTKE